jgi:hypothetical protein
MINLVRHVEECRSQTVSVGSGPEVVLGGCGIDVPRQAGNGREAIVMMRELDLDYSRHAAEPACVRDREWRCRWSWR